jgi:NAD(P)-dependent dehydrogenase (short-subunit alcohol dehydrogenase family)
MLMKQKVCVVTGAASPLGIGYATARMLAANGAHVALIDVSSNVGEAARKIAADHPESSILAVECNIASATVCEEASAKVKSVFNRVDALVHCAGIIRSGTYDKISGKDFDAVIAVNLTGAFNIIRAFTSMMVALASCAKDPPVHARRTSTANWQLSRDLFLLGRRVQCHWLFHRARRQLQNYRSLSDR